MTAIGSILTMILGNERLDAGRLSQLLLIFAKISFEVAEVSKFSTPSTCCLVHCQGSAPVTTFGLTSGGSKIFQKFYSKVKKSQLVIIWKMGNLPRPIPYSIYPLGSCAEVLPFVWLFPQLSQNEPHMTRSAKVRSVVKDFDEKKLWSRVLDVEGRSWEKIWHKYCG
ncbi:hypothetical protein C8J56DRAFT_195754 [Mycena floridula]|nr:hypothetical protein C8J56DRAFT_195754 [Mycena floridula]